jgi:hypothetical protein
MGQVDSARFVAGRRVRADDRWQLDRAKEAYRLFDQQTSGKGVFVL